MKFKFPMLDKFIAQKEKRSQEHGELVRREQSALETVHALKSKYEQVLRDSLVAKKDATKELDELHDKIEAAERAYARRKQERGMFHSVFKEEITTQQVVDAWNNEFIPQFREQRFDAVLKRMLEAKREYVAAVLDYYQAVNEFENIRSEARSELSDHYYYKLNGIELDSVPKQEKYFMDERDLRLLFNYKEIPNSVKTYEGDDK
ncbi:hypothetical protein [Aneurinibacillus aneurinilyticus]|uniref:hypothetical protein n=1 Tax=Aneurinibacillus aneurinilyticus TaxID=1391 RepID=UPI002E230342|nr:hypothetical protein [Aneurinibacillus aneurinilyticus]